MTVRILQGDCRDRLKELGDGSVHMVVTSPPYLGLRDYGVDGQLGQEATPEEFVVAMVHVFREVRRVLRKDGTLWLNIGDSYSTSGGAFKPNSSPLFKNRRAGKQAYAGSNRISSRSGLKRKDLMMMPERVAMALQQPYYTGNIKNERDRIWLASLIEGEGCFFIHKRHAGTPAYTSFLRKDGIEKHYMRTADTFCPGLSISNTNRAIIEHAQAIMGGSITTQTRGRKQLIYRLQVSPNEAKRITQEVYPHLIGKQQQARLVFNCPPSGRKAAAFHATLKQLHKGFEQTTDAPPPPTLFEEGWFLRSKIIWSKPNAMPESAKDRPTHSYDYIFLFSKSKRYFYDRDATAVPVSEATHARMSQDIEAQIGSARTYGGKRKNGNMKANVRGMTAAGGVNLKAVDRGSREHLKVRQNESFAESVAIQPTTRNDRDVWIIPAKGYTGAHFATFPPAIPERCILAGTSEKGCCPACGAPIRRVTKATYINDTTVSGRPAEGNRKQEAEGREDEVMGYDQRTRLVVTTVGWKATCEHVLAATGHPIPCTVLDLFGGAGTTGLVAERLHRNSILIELSQEYATMAERRIHDDAPLLADIRHATAETESQAAAG